MCVQRIEAAWLEDGVLYATDWCMPFLIIYDTRVEQVIKIIWLPRRLWGIERAFSKIFKMGNQLFLIPRKVTEILIFNLDSEAFSEIDVSNYCVVGKAAICGVVANERTVYLQSPINGLFELNLDNNNVYLSNSKYEFNFKALCYTDHDINVFTDVEGKEVGVLDSELRIIRRYEFNNDNYMCFAPILVNDNLYFLRLGMNKAVIMCDENGIKFEYDLPTENLELCNNYLGALHFDDRILFIPSILGGSIISYDICKHNIEPFRFIPNQEKYAFSTMDIIGDYIYAYDIYSSCYYMFSGSNYKKYVISFKDSYFCESEMINLVSGTKINESNEKFLNRYLDVILKY